MRAAHPLALFLLASMTLTSCHRNATGAAQRDAEEGPPPLRLIKISDASVFTVADPALYPLARAVLHRANVTLPVTGVVSPDVSRNVPVVSMASGRVLAIYAHLGDHVARGQLLMRIESPDIAAATDDYQQAQADEALARKQLDRAQSLYQHGAIAQQDLEQAQTAEDKAQVTLRTAAEKLRLLGADPAHPSPIVAITAPVSGVITDQQVTGAAGVQALATPSPFTISDLSRIWVLCDVYEDDLAQVRVGEAADITLDAYPDRIFRGVVNNIGPVLDPNTRTAKVRIALANPGFMRVGMFVNAVIHGPPLRPSVAVPATAVLHLHDRDWVYVPAGGAQFRRVPVVAGAMLPGNMQEIRSGIAAGQAVVTRALQLENEVEQ